jgi:hypothetical protein
VRFVTFEEMEKALRARLEGPPAGGTRRTPPRPDAPPTSIGPTGSASSGGYPETRTFGELLIEREEDKAARAVVFGLLAEMERK